MNKLWGGRFQKTPEKWVDEFNASISFDKELVEEDIQGSLAHVEMLKATNIIEEEEADSIQKGLQSLLEKAKNNELSFSVKYEDIHLNIEKLLIDEIGPVGGKLHTGRSRNDQVATDMHLYLRKHVQHILELIQSLQKALIEKAEDHVETILPGYTHLQRAQPISLAHHLLAYVWMLQRDKERFSESLKRINVCPLGSAALAGTTFPIDRQLTAKLLEFDRVYPNSLDAVSDRDFIVEFLSNSSLLMVHLSRFCEELILWCSQEFQFVEMDDTYSTGSSIMPQKKNPDMAELIRGKSGRVFGHLISLLTVLKGLPLAYNKDLQEDKEGMFDTVKTIEGCLEIMTGMIRTLKINKEKMEQSVNEDFSNATELADYLAKKGLPFRKAHEVVGKLVYLCIEKGIYLKDLSMAEFKEANELFDEDVYEVLNPYTAVNKRNSEGGTGFSEVKKQLHLAKSLIY
ncbi:argininosuccinate lyase [Aeribacillus alveayuensis]|uniref:Argininosuccinate lyase n=1 Tax=Aeribacillus alveayuensis TaxID=279215 RepID=A0ABT9VJC0_9BACI|nr:argininosuccinate lyase [Bacillus alveayuensis]